MLGERIRLQATDAFSHKWIELNADRLLVNDALTVHVRFHSIIELVTSDVHCLPERPAALQINEGRMRVGMLI